jgi:hypothetical protein
MRKRTNLCFSILLAGAFVGPAAAQQVQSADQTQPQSGTTTAAAPVTNVNQAVDRIIAREHDEIATIRHYDPLVETYIQEMKPDSDLGVVPVRDHYFLGEADLAKGVVDDSMLGHTAKSRLDQYNPLYHLSDMFKSEFVPAGFLQMVYVDTGDFDRQHYQFDYVRTEFLGDVKCYVFDVTPLPKSGRGRFKGRIWAENQQFTIVRFNGVYTPVTGVNGYNLHFDSWRLNLQPGLWLPAYIYSQESDIKDLFGGRVHFRAQTRLWGYDLRNVSHETEFSELTVESPSAVQDQAAAQEQDTGPVAAERAWQHEAELNVLDRLQRVGLLAPPGEIDKLLETVENNLEVANNLDVEPQVHCRVLLTGTLESFTIGHTIVLSRGLIDVLPDEASLATVLAQELADLMVIKPSDDQYGFNDTTNISALQVLSRFSFRENPEQVQRASDKAVQLLKNSIYKDKLGSAGLFLKQLEIDSKSLSALINPRIGNSVYLAQQLIASSPQLQPNKIDQIAALPIGARLKLDPWTDRVELLKAKPVPLYSAREKMPFEVTPFMPYLTRYQKPGAGVSAASAQPDVARQQQPPPRQQQPQPQQ